MSNNTLRLHNADYTNITYLLHISKAKASRELKGPKVYRPIFEEYRQRDGRIARMCRGVQEVGPYYLCAARAVG